MELSEEQRAWVTARAERQQKSVEAAHAERLELGAALAEDLHAVRHVGNFAAHPIKDEHSGEVVDVEPGEAEWLLDLLEQLFDHYFVAPARRSARRAALDAKLTGANKPTLPPSTTS